MILIDNKIPFIKGALDDVAELRYLNGSDFRKEDVKDAEALIIRTRTICNADLLRNSRLKFIATATIGFDHIDTDYCGQNGITWTNAPGCNSSSVEQYIVSALLELAYRKNFRPGDMTLGVIGVGNVGSKVTRAARILGMKVILNDPPRERVEGSKGFSSLDKIKQEADIIIFHVPLIKNGMDKTYKMAGNNFFKTLAKPVYLINTSRGDVVDETALLAALNQRIIKACILDVWENEPDINPELVAKTEFATPHIAGYSTDGKANGTSMSVQAVSRFFGLGKDSWIPENIPLPTNALISVDCNKLNEFEILRKVYSETYSILEDDSILRKDLSKFELNRGSYRLRREPKAFSVHLIDNKNENLVNKLDP